MGKERNPDNEVDKSPEKTPRIVIRKRHFGDIEKVDPEKFNVIKPLKSKRNYKIKIRNYSEDDISKSSET